MAAPPSGMGRAGRVYRLGTSTVRLGFGDLLDSNAQVLVSSDDYRLSMGGGVSGAISRAGGSAIAVDASKVTPCSLGDVVVTTAGVLTARHIFHVVTIGPRPNGDQGTPDQHLQLVTDATATCLTRLEALGLATIAFPAIGAGAAGIEPETVALAMADAIEHHLRTTNASLGVEVHLKSKSWQDDLDYLGFFESFGERLRQPTERSALESRDEPDQLAAESAPPAPNRILEVGRQRAEVEASIAHDVGAGRTPSAWTTARLVRTTQELASELGARTPIKLFVSYAHHDRQVVGEFVKHLAGLQLAGAATWIDQSIAPGEAWQDEISQALEEAQIAVFLVTASFLSSRYCVGREWTRAKERRSAGELVMVPVVLKPCNWQPLVGELQVLPVAGTPMTQHADFDAACVDVIDALHAQIDNLRNTR